MSKVRKGDAVQVGSAVGKVLYAGVTKLFVDFGNGFTCLVLIGKVRKAQ